MSVKWTSREIQTFFDLYKKHEILWNIHRRDYRNRHSRDSAWEELLFDLQSAGLSCENVNDLKNRIRILKTVYMQELRKIKKSKDSAESVEEVYEPKLVWFERADCFLRNVSRLRGFVTHKVKIGKVPKEEIPTPSTTFNECDDDSMQHVVSPPQSPSEYQPKRSPKKKCTNPANKSDFFLKRIDTRLERDDQYDIVGKNVAMKLRILPEDVQPYTEKFINDILFEAKIGNITRHSRLHIVNMRREQTHYPPPTEVFITETTACSTDEGEE